MKSRRSFFKSIFGAAIATEAVEPLPAAIVEKPAAAITASDSKPLTASEIRQMWSVAFKRHLDQKDHLLPFTGPQGTFYRSEAP